MDLWVVAAAAGAGYVAKNLPNFSVDKKEPPLKYSYNLHSESKNFLQQLRDKTCPLRRLDQKTVQDDIFPDLENHSEASVASTSGDYSKKIGILEDFNKGYNYSLSGGFGVGQSQQFGDGESVTLSRINGGKLITSKRRQVYSSMSAFRPVLVTDTTWEETKREDNASSPSLRQFQSLEELKKPDKSSSSSQGAETVLLFITGMTIGIMTATTSLKSEVDQLNKQLEQMQSLVQDLHEELERENKGEYTPVEPVSSPAFDKLSKSNGVKANDKNAENLELLSRIEAELQAELEMLEQNMKVSELQRIITGGVELDEDFAPEIVQGDLKPAMVEEASEPESRITGTASDYSKPANYAVSPQELSLRLHELIESRLEMRIKELEIALSQSENRVDVLHSVVSGRRRFSYSETESSSTHHTPACICDEHEKGEDKPSSGNHFSSNGESGSKVVDPGTRSINNDVPQIWDKQRFMGLMVNEDSMSEDEGSDESDMLLIKQIIERSKSGSSFYFQID